MSRRRLMIGLAGLSVAGLLAVSTPASSAPTDQEKGDARVTSPDGTEIAVTWFRPGGLPPGLKIPVILAGHGWSGSRVRDFDDDIVGGITVQHLLDEAYGVVSIDARGHGESGGQAFLHHPDQGVEDYRAVIDWISDNLDWVKKEGPAPAKDIIAGGLGASYGGGFQLMTAAFDDRLDALVPIVTWNSLLQSLGPNGVPRSAWVTLLYAAGKASVDMDPRIDQWFLETAATNQIAPDLARALTEASPATWMENIDVPTLLVQGMPDTLFPVNEGVANYLGIRENGVPVWLLGVNTGHVLPQVQPTGIGGPGRTRDDDCGDPEQVALDFYDAFLRGDDDARARIEAFPRVTLPTEQGGCVTGPDWPLPDRSVESLLGTLAIPQAMGWELLPLLTAEEETTVAGIPRFEAAVPVQLDDIFFVSLVLLRDDGFHVVDDQVTPIRTRLGALGGQISIDLAGVATTLRPGETLYLKIDGLNEQFFGNGNRRPGAVALTDVKVTIPLVEG